MDQQQADNLVDAVFAIWPDFPAGAEARLVWAALLGPFDYQVLADALVRLGRTRRRRPMVAELLEEAERFLRGAMIDELAARPASYDEQGIVPWKPPAGEALDRFLAAAGRPSLAEQEEIDAKANDGSNYQWR